MKWKEKTKTNGANEWKIKAEVGGWNAGIVDRKNDWKLGIKYYKPNNNTKLITKPIRPDASTKEKPINENLNNSSRWEGFLLIE